MVWKDVQYKDGKFKTNDSGSGSVNNAYKSVKVGSTTISASGEDTIELSAGNNITLTPDAINKKVTINATGGTVSKLSDLSDVYLPSAQYLHEGEFLGWDSTMQEWQNKYPTLMHTYSTTEQVVGTWVNGKPVYEKTIECTIASGTRNTAHSITNLDLIISCDAVAQSSTEKRPIPFVYGNGTSTINTQWYCGITITASNIMLETGSQFASAHSKAWVTLRYTKNTD